MGLCQLMGSLEVFAVSPLHVVLKQEILQVLNHFFYRVQQNKIFPFNLLKKKEKGRVWGVNSQNSPAAKCQSVVGALVLKLSCSPLKCRG